MLAQRGWAKSVGGRRRRSQTCESQYSVVIPRVLCKAASTLTMNSFLTAAFLPPGAIETEPVIFGPFNKIRFVRVK